MTKWWKFMYKYKNLSKTFLSPINLPYTVKNFFKCCSKTVPMNSLKVKIYVFNRIGLYQYFRLKLSYKPHLWHQYLKNSGLCLNEIFDFSVRFTIRSPWRRHRHRRRRRRRRKQCRETRRPQGHHHFRFFDAAVMMLQQQQQRRQWQQQQWQQHQ